jgi:hypothetical protein
MLPPIVLPDIASEYCSELLTLECSETFDMSGGDTSCGSSQTRSARLSRIYARTTAWPFEFGPTVLCSWGIIDDVRLQRFPLVTRNVPLPRPPDLTLAGAQSSAVNVRRAIFARDPCICPFPRGEQQQLNSTRWPFGS